LVPGYDLELKENVFDLRIMQAKPEREMKQ